MAFQYIALVIAQNRPGKTAKRGDIVAVRPNSMKWGKKETLPLFEKIAVELADPTSVTTLLTECRYDFDAKCFRVKADKAVFDEVTDTFPLRERKWEDTDRTENDQLARKLNAGLTVAESCDFLGSGLGVKNPGGERAHWFRAFYPFRKMPGVRNLITAVREGPYHEIQKALVALTEEEKQTIYKAVGRKEQAYLRFLLRGSWAPTAEPN